MHLVEGVKLPTRIHYCVYVIARAAINEVLRDITL